MKHAERIIQLLILSVFILASQFYNLDQLAFRLWDESRLATNAYEMSKSGNWWVTTVNQKPDMWNTKPPLMIWAQAICIKLNGLNEWSTRLPSALCATLTILLIYFFILRIIQNGWAALLAGIVLCTSLGYFGHHGTRFGEYDSMLTLFTTAALISFFLYTELPDDRKNKMLLLFFISISLAVLTKGIAGLLFGPPLLIYLIARKQFIATLRDKYLYIGIAIFLVTVLGYYFLREHYNPGYIKAVFENELGGRFGTALEGHEGPPDFYYKYLRWHRFGSWFWALWASLFLCPFIKNKQQRRLLIFSQLCIILYFIILSTSKTKIFWYDLPAYPLFAICIALTILQLSVLIARLLPFLQPKLILVLLIIIFSIQPVYEAFDWIQWKRDDISDGLYNISYYVRDTLGKEPFPAGVIYFSDGNDIQGKLYAHALNEAKKDIAIASFWDPPIMQRGNKVITHQPDTQNYIESKYRYRIISQWGNVKVYEIIQSR